MPRSSRSGPSRPSRRARLVAVALAAVGLLAGSLAVAPAAVADTTVAAPLPPGGSFVPVTPTRVLDTRQGGGTTRYADFDASSVLPRNGSSGVAAVLVNVTVVDARSAGYVTVGSAVGGTSNGNFVAGKASATLALVPYTRPIRVTPSSPANLVVDVQGYVTTRAAATSASFTPLATARRVADTRSGTGLQPFPGRGTQSLDVRRLADLPATATAVVANVTVASATASTYVTGWSGSGTRPTVSTVNADAGDTVANRALLPLDGDGRVALYNDVGRTDLLVDVVGYLSPDDTGSYYTPASPVRLLDTSTTAASVTPTITDNDGVTDVLAPSVRDLAPTTAAWLTVVGDQPAGPGYVATRPGGAEPSGTSDLNLVPSRAVANAGPARVSDADGTVTVTSSVPTRLVVDLSGWFRRTTTPADGLWRTSRYPTSGTLARIDTLPSDRPTSYAHATFAGNLGFGGIRGYRVASLGTVEAAVFAPSEAGGEPLPPNPVTIGTLTGVTTVVTAGDDFDAATYALDGQGRLYGWQDNASGELARKPTDTFVRDAVSAIPLPGNAAATAVFAAPGIGYAVLADDAHTVLSWGRADTSQLGRVATAKPWKPAPVTFPTGAPVQIAGDDLTSFGIDAAGLTTWWGKALPADGGSTPTTQATPALFADGCLLASSLYTDPDGVWERCTDGSVVQLTSQGRLFASRQTLPVGGVTAIGPGAGTGSGIRAVLADGRVADVPTTAARYEAGFADVTAVNGTRDVQVTLVGS